MHRFVKMLIVIFFATFLFTACKFLKNTTSSPTQIGPMGSKQIILDYWGCSMIFYDFNKYYPLYLNEYKKLANKSCFLPSSEHKTHVNHYINTVVNKFDPNLELDIAKTIIDLNDKYLFDIDEDSRDQLPNYCFGEFDYVRNLNAHLSNLKNGWTFKRCTNAQAIAEMDNTIILDTPACIGECDLGNTSCYTCTMLPNKYVELASQKKNPMSITCGSKDDAKNAVQDYCKSYKQNCEVTCAPSNIEITGKAISGTYLDTETSSTIREAYSVSLEGSIEPEFAEVSIGGISSSTSKDYEYELTSTLSINSGTSGITPWIKTFYNNKMRIESRPGSLYSCSINKIKINSINHSSKVTGGPTFLGIGLVVGHETSLSSSNSRSNTLTKYNFSAGGKTLEEIKNECNLWSKYVARNSITHGKTINIETAKGLKCTFSDTNTYKINHVVFHSGDNNYIEFGITKYIILGKESPKFFLSREEMERANKIKNAISSKNEAITLDNINTGLKNIFDSILIPITQAQADTNKWRILSCEQVLLNK